MTGRRVIAAVEVAAVMAAVIAVGASGSPSGSTAEGVSFLKYAPKRVYDNGSRLRVTFTTTGRAGAGREYSVQLYISGPDALGGDPDDCTYITGSEHKPPIVGGPGKTYTVVLRTVSVFGDFWCPGRAKLVVTTNSIRSPASIKVREMRTLRFRVYRAP